MSGWVEYQSTVELLDFVYFRILSLRQMRGGEVFGIFYRSSTAIERC
jgi:hypothetical protein